MWFWDEVRVEGEGGGMGASTRRRGEVAATVLFLRDDDESRELDG